MAQKTIVTTWCDRCSAEGVEREASQAGTSIVYSWNGVYYNVDLCEEHLEQTANYVESLVEVSHKTNPGLLGGGGAPRPRRRAAPTGVSKYDTKAVRDWAQKKGKVVAERGRIPKNVIAEYEADMAATA